MTNSGNQNQRTPLTKKTHKKQQSDAAHRQVVATTNVSRNQRLDSGLEQPTHLEPLPEITHVNMTSTNMEDTQRTLMTYSPDPGYGPGHTV